MVKEINIFNKIITIHNHYVNRPNMAVNFDGGEE